MALRRGFKAEANWYAREMRRELDLAAYGPLCPWKLAGHLGFPVVAMTDFAAKAPNAVTYLGSARGREEFSAITLHLGFERLIIHNDRHHPKRQAANIAHELAHGLLLHPPKAPFDKQGSRHYNRELEDEASWLGPALLVSDEAALFIARRRMSLADASDYFGASEELIRMRLNVSGAYIRARRSA